MSGDVAQAAFADLTGAGLASRFPLLSSPITLGNRRLRNRIVLSAHDTGLARRGLPGEDMIAYYEARAAGGVGMIVIQAAGVHGTARYWPKLMMAHEDSCIPAFAALVQRLRAFDVVIVGQLFHGGRVSHGRNADGLLQAPFAPSAMPGEAGGLPSRAMSTEMIEEIAAGYASAAARLTSAGMDGVEITGAHGYLPGQFLDPAANRRLDEYGGSPEKRLKFVRDIIAATRGAIGPDRLLGLRLSVSADDHDPAERTSCAAVCAALEATGSLDYFSLALGDESTHSGAVHIIPPMAMASGYVAPAVRAVRVRLSTPVIAVGRINDPQMAERLIAEGAADLCGGARAMIADPDFANKVTSGRHEDIRACIGCNQACVGHLEEGYSISCIQFPESGRETRRSSSRTANPQSEVMVIGGGPAGMKAAITAAGRGHEVTLYEAGSRLGGQVQLAERLPGRAEFGGLATNLQHELALAGVRVIVNVSVTTALIVAQKPGLIVHAAGAFSVLPERYDGATVSTDTAIVDAWQVLSGAFKPGHNVVVFDWRADWIGPGVAELLARNGHNVRLAVNGSRLGDHLQTYVRDMTAARIHALPIAVTPYCRFFGVEGGTAYFSHSISGEPILFENVDTLVVAGLHRACTTLDETLAAYSGRVIAIGDCVAPRTAEEAVFEGWQAGLAA